MASHGVLEAVSRLCCPEVAKHTVPEVPEHPAAKEDVSDGLSPSPTLAARSPSC